MHSSLDRSLLWFWVLFLCAEQAGGGDTRLEIQTVRAPAVIESDRAFLREDSSEDLLRAFDDDPRPLSLAAGDFDGDGMPDLAAGFAVENGSFGLVALWRGNIDTLFSWSHEARQRRAEGGFTETPFLGPPAVFAVPEPPELLAAGRFDRDAHLDLLAAAGNGGTVYLLDGNGRGGLGEATTANLAALPLAWATAGSDPAAEPEADPVATLELRLNSDAFPDLVFLERDSIAPAVLLTAFDRTFTVDSDGDLSDDIPGNGVCSTSGGVCTLRAAIQEANFLGGSTEVAFNINPGTDFLPREIAVGSELPHLSAAITIDASTQAKVIAISSTGSFAAPGLTLDDNQVVRDLYIWGFGGSGLLLAGSNSIAEGCRIGKTSNLLLAGGTGNLNGIEVTGIGNLVGGSATGSENVVTGNGAFGISVSDGTGNTIEGNYVGTDREGDAIPTSVFVQPFGVKEGAINDTAIKDNVISGNDVGLFLESSPDTTRVKGNKIGTDVSGALALANRIGVSVSGGSPPVGGATMSDRNIISGNHEAGLEILGTTGTPYIEGNYVGTNVNGNGALANGRGVDVTGSVSAGLADNLISGNTGHGVFIHSHQPATDMTTFERNLIGTDAGGSLSLANGGYGIWVADSSTGIRVGDDFGSDDANRIAFNLDGGVGVGSGSSGVELGANELFGNGRLGIDLVAAMFLWDGVTLNDPVDGDAGPNGLQNFPVITLVNDSISQVSWQLHSTPSTGFDVTFYSSASCDPSGYGEGEAYLGARSRSTDANGDFSEVGTNLAVWPAGHYVTAVATNTTTGNSSEFSMCRRDDATCPYPPDLVLTDAQIVGAQSFSACQSITTTGAFEIGLLSSAVLTAGESVELGSGFKVFGDLTVEIDPALATP